ncbi:MAG: hypothetical protein HUU01_15900 [Saprospiraceae bacterium]|nr:hypothetical protein [Saprospiraceae bacterium]
MKKLKFILVLLFFWSIAHSFGQTNELLEQLPETKEQFIESEKKVIATINWLENTPLNQEEDKRKAQNLLLIAWITNSPTVTVELYSYVPTLTEKNPDLLVMFLGGWTKYALENNYSKDLSKCNIAGIKSTIKVYKNGINIKKNKAMEKIIKLDEKGELEKWVTEQLAKK